ncbi:hypothetical protein [Shimia sp.]|uniref:hypothetical protein n=1 Tax=Shimia sp. TaxID=1954381 RepID=UPI0032970943
MLLRSLGIVAFVSVCAGPVWANDDVYYVSGGGDDYVITANANGYVLTSRYPKARFVEAGVNSHVVRGVETFYFGKDCDAAHTLFGAGTWGWANGGFGADFESFQLRFPRQELPDGPGLECRW